jgi:starch synthase
LNRKVAFASNEVAPFAKVGGLADVAGSLPKALKARGHDVRIVMPAYQMVLDATQPKPLLGGEPLDVECGSHWNERAYLWETTLGDVPVWLIGSDHYFRDTVSSQTVYLPGAEQHLFFARAFMALAEKSGWIPDVIHANDWHTGFMPVFLRESAPPAWSNTASVFTIHNLAYQGEFGPDLLAECGLPWSLFNHHQLETYGAVNFLKAGSVFADQVNTVSPRYAEEIQTPEFGCRLEGLMKHLASQQRLSGIVNGIDQHEFNPEIDPHIPAHFSAKDLAGKATCRAELRKELGLDDRPGVPLFGVVSRLSNQKGMDLILEISDALMNMPAQLIVQGLGDSWIAEQMRHLEVRYPHQMRFVERFDAPLAQRVYAGSDLFLMPSAFEPCGLGQLIAMRYGTIPVVRYTGGLANTVQDAHNGFVFADYQPDALLATVQRAVSAFSDPEHWNRLVQGAMATDSGWDRSAAEYESVYERAIASRRVHQAA